MKSDKFPTTRLSRTADRVETLLIAAFLFFAVLLMGWVADWGLAKQDAAMQEQVGVDGEDFYSAEE